MIETPLKEATRVLFFGRAAPRLECRRRQHPNPLRDPADSHSLRVTRRRACKRHARTMQAGHPHHRIGRAQDGWWSCFLDQRASSKVPRRRSAASDARAFSGHRTQSMRIQLPPFSSISRLCIIIQPFDIDLHHSKPPAERLRAERLHAQKKTFACETPNHGVPADRLSGPIGAQRMLDEWT